MESQETREKCIHFFRALPCIFMAGSWSDLCLGAWRRPFFLPAFKPIPKTRGVGFFDIIVHKYDNRGSYCLIANRKEVSHLGV